MATIEDVVSAIDTLLREELPAHLTTVQGQYADGLLLEPLRSIEWAELDHVEALPAALIVGMSETDGALRDQMRDVRVLLFVLMVDGSYQHLVKKLYRYAKALRRLFRAGTNRSLSGTITSIKVEGVQYSPTFTDRNTLYARDMQIDLVARVPKGDD